MGQSVRFVPISLFGAPMGIAGLALATRAATGVLGTPAWLAEVLAFAAIAALLATGAAYVFKWAHHPDAVTGEFANPATLGFFGAFPIALALGAACLFPYAPALGKSLWWISVLTMVLLEIVILSRWLAGEVDLAAVNTGWMIAMIGPVPMAGGGIAVGELESARFLFGVGLISTPLVMGLVFNRKIVGPRMPDALRPTTFILLVPPALIYLYPPLLWNVQSGPLLESLFYFDLVLAGGLLLFARRCLHWPFSAAWWGFTFPLDALASASLGYAALNPTATALVVAWTSWLLALFVVAVVSVRSLQALARGTLFVAPGPAGSQEGRAPAGPRG